MGKTAKEAHGLHLFINTWGQHTGQWREYHEATALIQVARKHAVNVERAFDRIFDLGSHAMVFMVVEASRKATGQMVLEWISIFTRVEDMVDIKEDQLVTRLRFKT